MESESLGELFWGRNILPLTPRVLHLSFPPASLLNGLCVDWIDTQLLISVVKSCVDPLGTALDPFSESPCCGTINLT